MTSQSEITEAFTMWVNQKTLLPLLPLLLTLSTRPTNVTKPMTSQAEPFEIFSSSDLEQSRNQRAAFEPKTVGLWHENTHTWRVNTFLLKQRLALITWWWTGRTPLADPTVGGRSWVRPQWCLQLGYGGSGRFLQGKTFTEKKQSAINKKKNPHGKYELL